ncbi:MAG: hypothetical protein J3K34DRAFT_458915 [Monoraphidium minutum]|nr:MAG: hypothetical protein J3K34DRAFT_458915 [Monoraphidium minutum]
MSSSALALPDSESLGSDLLVARGAAGGAPGAPGPPPALLASEASVRRAGRDAAWAAKREHAFAALAAGFHLAIFAYNLAFWGFEGTAPDRYWPSNPRYRLQVRPGRYGNLEGSKSLYYYYLSRMEGGR